MQRVTAVPPPFAGEDSGAWRLCRLVELGEGAPLPDPSPLNGEREKLF